jgi:hypothetical protein
MSFNRKSAFVNPKQPLTSKRTLDKFSIQENKGTKKQAVDEN